MDIREMRESDLPQVAALAEQLGYPLTLEQLRARFHKVHTRTADQLLVAIASPNNVLGWIHLQAQEDLLTEAKGEVRALVVDAAHRGQGIGKLLLKAGEEWIRARGVDTLFLRTNITREAAHRFYQRENFELKKTSHVFVKEI
jgi:GNAT superfamily N-acetyltransferase